MSNLTLRELSDDELVAGFRELVIREQEKLVLQLDHLAELDRRKLFHEYDSLRAFLIGEYGMESYQAERRIRAARLLRRMPELRSLLWAGKLNLSLLEIALGYAHRERLEDAELLECFQAISGKSCESARRELAGRYPGSAELPHDRVRPLTGELSELRCVVKNEVLELLGDARGLLSHSHPGLSMGEVIEAIASEYRTRHHPEEKARRAAARADRKDEARREEELEMEAQDQDEPGKNPSEEVGTPTSKRPGPASEARIFPPALEYELILKDGYRCAYVDVKTGKRCTCKRALERDHVVPWADGGRTDSLNGRFLCPNHHRRVSFLRFGEASRYFRSKRE